MMKHKDDFPPLAGFKKREYQHYPKIPTPREVDTSGNAVSNSKTEMVLNWQTKNVVQQNKAIFVLQTNVSKIRNDLKQHVSANKKQFTKLQKNMTTSSEKVTDKMIEVLKKK